MHKPPAAYNRRYVERSVKDSPKAPPSPRSETLADFDPSLLDILTISKMDSGLLVVAPCEVQPSVLIEQSLRMFAGEVEESGINLRCMTDQSYNDNRVDWVLLDPSRLLQVFLNLVSLT